VTVFSNVQSPVFLCSPEHQSVNKQGFGLLLGGMVGSFFHSYDSSDVDISRFSLRSLRFEITARDVATIRTASLLCSLARLKLSLARLFRLA